jgi:two-component system, probable response regulator PhcQ
VDHTVLLVDDDPNLLSGLTRALRKQPFQIYTAHDAQEATWILKTRNVDVLVTDENMPGMCGADLAAWVADNCPQVMRIMLTGHAELKTVMRAINDLGVCRFFTKPCNEARLAVAIQKAIEQKDAQSTNRQTLESQQRQLHELEQRHRNFEAQVRRVTDDLYGPLQTLVDCCRGLQEQLADRSDLEARQLLAEATNAASTCQDVTARLKGLALSASAPSVTSSPPADPPTASLEPPAPAAV